MMMMMHMEVKDTVKMGIDTMIMHTSVNARRITTAVVVAVAVVVVVVVM